MLASSTTQRRVSQAPLKITNCLAGCGAEVSYRTNPRVCCEHCRRTRALEAARVCAAARRRKHGVPQVKGRIIACERCGASVTLKRNAATKYCPPCRIEADRALARHSSRQRFATPEGREAANKYQRDKRRSDPATRLSAHMRGLMHRGLGSMKAGRSWRVLVPYTLKDLIEHLERQFLPGMTLSNHGAWHIDHIRPLCGFRFERPEDPAFQEAWALANLRPLWARDNISKNGRRFHLL